MEVKRYYESSFATEDIGRLQSDYNLVAEYAREAAYALAYDVDNWLLGYRPVLKKAGQVISTGAGNPLNRAAILLARLRLDQARIPQEGRYWMISPAQHTSLLTIPEFINTDYVNDKPTVSGVVGYLYGDPVIVNNNLVKNTLNGIDLNVGRGAPQLVPTPGYGVAGNFSPWIPNATLNGDPNGAGQENLVLADLLTVNAYSAMYCHPDWLMMWMPQAPKSETDRMVTFQADAVVNTIFYRPECGLVVESFETA
jgi:hypothetical protein